MSKAAKPFYPSALSCRAIASSEPGPCSHIPTRRRLRLSTMSCRYAVGNDRCQYESYTHCFRLRPSRAEEEVYVQSFPDPGAKLIVSSDGGTEPAWSPTGRELFYRQRDAMMTVVVDTEPELNLGAPSRLFERAYVATVSTVRNYDVSADGQRFIMVERVDADGDDGETLYFDVVLNWPDLLDRNIPAAN